MEVQKEFDWPRAWKLRLLDEMRLPDGPYLNKNGNRIVVNKTMLVSALRTLDSMIGSKKTWRAKWETLAAWMGCSRATVKRAVKVLESMSLVAIHEHKESGWRSHEFQIIWSNLQDHRVSGARVQLEPSEGSTCTDRGFNLNLPRVQLEPSSIPPMSSAHLPAHLPAQRDGESEMSLDGRGAIAERLRKALRVTSRSPSGDIDLIAKVAILIDTRVVSEQSVAESLDAVKCNRADVPCAYFHTALNAAVGGELNAMLWDLERRQRKSVEAY